MELDGVRGACGNVQIVVRGPAGLRRGAMPAMPRVRRGRCRPRVQVAMG